MMRNMTPAERDELRAVGVTAEDLESIAGKLTFGAVLADAGVEPPVVTLPSDEEKRRVLVRIMRAMIEEDDA